MRPPGFAYFQPESVDAAVAVLAEHAGGARVLAGGQSLLPLLNRRQLRPAALVDLRRLTDELRHVSHVDGELRIGALARHVDLERFAPQHGDLPLVAAAAALDLAADGTVRAARIALAGVADRPVRLAGAEQALLGATPDEKAIRHVASIVVKEIDPPSDRRADAGYRAELAGALLTRALRESAQSPFAQSHALEAQR